MDEGQRQRRAGLMFGVGAYLLWGVMPLYFKALTHVGPVEIVAHRILWSLVFLGALIALWRRWPAVRAALANRRAMLLLAVTSVLIAVNWLVYIYAVVSGHVLEGSLGYYLNPLVNILLGVVILKERLSRLQVAATLIAGAGVVALAAGAGSGLWISLVLAVSFASYGFLRKIAPVEALEGLSIETVILAPLALGWVLWLQQAGTGSFLAAGPTTALLLALGGAVTAVPLLLFTAAARRLPYSTLGFLQYLAPSLQFLLAVLAFGEPLTRAHAICFGAIWTALALFTFDGLRAAHRARIAAAEIA
ncbi:MAG: EamA family transporter RarD [Sphingomonas sp.]|nr:EamA family transporter RarD [Sphingomonas sp.]